MAAKLNRKYVTILHLLPPPPFLPRLIVVIHRIVSLLLFFCSPFFVSYFCSFLGAFSKLRKATINVIMYVCLSVRTEHLSSKLTDFHEILYLNI